MGRKRGQDKMHAHHHDVRYPNHGGKLHFLETLHALAGRVAGTDLPRSPRKRRFRDSMADRLPTFGEGKASQSTPPRTCTPRSTFKPRSEGFWLGTGCESS